LSLNLIWPLHFPFLSKKRSMQGFRWAEGVLRHRNSGRFSVRYKNSVSPRSSVYEWHAMFKNGRASVNDEQLAHPSISSKKVKQSLYRPLGSQDVEAPRFKDSQHMVVGLAALLTSRLEYPPKEIFLVLISVKGCVDPRVTVWPEGLCQWKIPMTPSGTEATTFRLVAQCLNQLRHHMPLTHILYWWKTLNKTMSYSE
jgi:hypothetical protein